MSHNSSQVKFAKLKETKKKHEWHLPFKDKRDIFCQPALDMLAHAASPLRVMVHWQTSPVFRLHA